MNKLNPIKYIENMLSHHPKSISLWITEGIVINGERYIIKEFRLRDGSLYAVIAENKYTPKYFEVKLAPDEETLKDIYKAIEENKIAIEKEVTDRKNDIARVDNAIKANTTKIEQEITDRKSEIARVDKAIEANTVKIDKEISDRESEIERVDQAIEANTEKINQEITDRQNEITRVDNAINANTAKIDKEIQDRKNEITRVDGTISANTTKINKEIQDRKDEITRVEGKIPKSAGGRNLALGTSSEWSNPYIYFNGGINTVINIAKVLTSGLKVGDTLKVYVEVKYENIVPTEGKTATIYSQDSGNVTEWNSGGFSFSESKTFSGSGEIVFEITDTINSDHLKNTYWNWSFRLDYVKSGSFQFRLAKVEAGDLPTPWEPAPEDYDSKLATAQSEIKQTTDAISARVTSLDQSTVKNSSLTINADGTVMKAGKTTTDIANAIGSYFAVNQNAINKFSDKINVKTAMIADGAVTSAKIAREITLDTLTCGKLNSTNGVTAFDLNTGTLKFTNNSGRIQRAYRDKVIEITDYITSTSGAQDYATSAFVVRKSDNSKQAAVKLTLDNTKAEATITSDLFYISDPNSKMLFSVDRTNNVVSDWGDIPIAHVLGGLVANDVSIGGRSKSLLKIVDELCKKAGITWF